MTLHSSQHQKMAAKSNHRVLAIILQLTVLLSVVLPLFTQAATSLSKSGCPDRCGAVVIPYPFGTGPGCFLNDWFEVTCGDDSKPVLKKLAVEIKEIRLPRSGSRTGWIFVDSPIMASSSDCLSGTAKLTTATPLDFTGSNFYFSGGYNNFVGSGCSNQANLIDKKLKSVPDTGCTSSCSSDSKIGDCCKSSIPNSIQLFNVSFTSAVADDTDCKYATIVSVGDWLDYHPTTSCSTAMKDASTVPAWIEFGLKSSSAEAQALLKQSEAKNATIGIKTYTYDDGNDVQFAFCADGFQGSAYLTDGCQDIDECTDTPDICTSGTCANTYGSYQCIPGKTKSQIVVKVASPVVGVLLLIGAIWLAFWFLKRTQEKKHFERNGGKLLESEEDGARIKIYKAHELKKATNNFSKKNKLGAGGQGTVYKGTLKGGTPVAVKLCNRIEPSKKKPKTSTKGAADIESAEEPAGAFITELTLVSKTLHTNIVKLLGCCLKSEVPMLVFERLVNGDLAHHLQKDRDSKDGEKFTLSWETRLNIALQTAEGLKYLHRQAGGILHRDVKTDNILLDNTFTAKLADFGISQTTEEPKNKPDQATASKDAPGSPGYMDPEYMETRNYTDKSDVYSFGVVLAELLTGKRPVYTIRSNESFDENRVILADYFKALETEKIMATFLDARVKHQGKKNEVEAVIAIAKRCLEREGKNRPKMAEVVIALEKIRSKQNEVYAEEMEEHDYEASVEVTASPLGRNQQTKPLRHQDSTSSDMH